ncbi:MAG TPA: BadF/BadG/BcrA/BcrD ATPase family protein [Thermoanaerobaculia bacterium]|nr:BadF/BadG/BcrA/BcrD ATPase family protein [Thermoanaerobaculia bacterium]
MTAMDVYVGIDLGSTTTKAVVLDGDGNVIGRGITNSRSNYEAAAKIVREEAFVRTRFTLLERAVNADRGFLDSLEQSFRMHQNLEQLQQLRKTMMKVVRLPRHKQYAFELAERVGDICDRMEKLALVHFAPGASRKSDFFRDLAAADYMHLAEKFAEPKGMTFEVLCGIFDSAILTVENMSFEGAFERLIGPALQDVGPTLSRTVPAGEPALRDVGPTLSRTVPAGEPALRDVGPTLSRTMPVGEPALRAIESIRLLCLNEVGTVGTGYGRQRLPFPKEQIRSEILCHGLGAHAMFPGTRTVLDIGGQDTKAIQLDSEGIVTTFQMNDRCAAGCGRYLGYIADEMNLGVHELGPLAQQSTCQVKINSTCTVFAGAELRERLALGQSREDILKGLHRAIILRAMSLLARSGGINDEFTFTGGVARNEAAVGALMDLVRENYGERKLNTSADSIYTGALGAALFALRAAERKAA